MRTPEPASKKRKVRKGTHSCWECRRRKIKCTFARENDLVCVNCQAKASSTSSRPQDEALAQRLIRLEAMMGRLADPQSKANEYNYPRDMEDDLLETSAARHANLLETHAPTPSQSASGSPYNRQYSSPAGPRLPEKLKQLSRDVYALLPSAKLRSTLAYSSPGATTVLSGFHAAKSPNIETPASLADPHYPTPDTHPVLITRRLLQYAVCVQNLSPVVFASIAADFDGKRPCHVLANWLGASEDWVLSSDPLIGSIEGIECLVLMTMLQGDAGQLRKAWMTCRRALNMAQLMGLDKKVPPLPRSLSSRHADPATLWFRIQCGDRYHSLILGLPFGSRNDPPFDPSSTPLDNLGKSYATVARKISERNEVVDQPDAYAVTQALDLQLENTACLVENTWWSIPDISAALNRSPLDMLSECSAIRLQVRHYTLLILLHLPYLMKGGDRYSFNRLTCMRASRAVLERFLAFRKDYIVYVAGRHIDYSALIAAMTLMLGHLGQVDPQREDDRSLVEAAHERLLAMGQHKTDKLSSESAETIRAMLPIVSGQGLDSDVHLSIPFLGTVNINSKPAQPVDAPSDVLPTPGSTLNGVGPADFAPFLSFDFNDFTFQGSDIVAGDVANGIQAFNGDKYDVPGGWMDFPSGANDWAFQGVDTTYWTMLNQSFNEQHMSRDDAMNE
ncbi:uncharacterized protein J7T54_004538 [Emericellopsis cladophorae]|uniref:Xylanolytic transcriptional activator regulatory domain-containing protein n=1 Tax=Emericellopsis cladophorae TaxID=2686198 RepID=A0A9Q0BFH9_9HYPO|nr:uncharacterized protein J7T54_004538 [Emericellopsis cladophorae]KAI6783992.1 hypothetical protein J7T54_004538 [Emericellopsis cladophorae]